MELEIKIEPHSESMRFYCIYYRYKKKYNPFNFWKQLVCVWDGAYLRYNQPVLFSDFNTAVEFGKSLQRDPNSIKKHYQKEDQKYKQAKKRRDQYYNSRNKTIVI